MDKTISMQINAHIFSCIVILYHITHTSNVKLQPYSAVELSGKVQVIYSDPYRSNREHTPAIAEGSPLRLGIEGCSCLWEASWFKSTSDSWPATTWPPSWTSYLASNSCHWLTVPPTMSNNSAIQNTGEQIFCHFLFHEIFSLFLCIFSLFLCIFWHEK